MPGVMPGAPSGVMPGALGVQAVATGRHDTDSWRP